MVEKFEGGSHVDCPLYYMTEFGVPEDDEVLAHGAVVPEPAAVPDGTPAGDRA
ncbi:hypothetical protein [Kitasatospora phosalacinea]|uniref:hypothetical protein n=1 Tax=Kitasatospora phosalacinea TaxID=2065 RepID=UPI000AF357D3|nr:hypothetical protein [Kitasatospora phosalacinea]